MFSPPPPRLKTSIINKTETYKTGEGGGGLDGEGEKKEKKKSKERMKLFTYKEGGNVGCTP